jgi:uncharacterized protein (TIGR03067 family)
MFRLTGNKSVLLGAMALCVGIGISANAHAAEVTLKGGAWRTDVRGPNGSVVTVEMEFSDHQITIRSDPPVKMDYKFSNGTLTVKTPAGNVHGPVQVVDANTIIMQDPVTGTSTKFVRGNTPGVPVPPPLPPIPPTPPPVPRDDFERITQAFRRLTGAWELVTVGQHGKTSSPSSATTIDIAGTFITLVRREPGKADVHEVLAYDIYPLQDNRNIDIKPLSGPNKDQVLHAIYEVTGDTLRIAGIMDGHRDPNNPNHRPTTFEGKGTTIVLTYKRVKR